MAGIKIVDLPAVGRDLAATDLFEMSLVGGTGSRKITGQEIMNASKLSVNNTPVINGTSGRIFFQDAANVLQQSANLFWDSLNNTLNILGNASLNNIFAEGNVIVDTANVWLSNGYAIGEYSLGNNRIEFYTTKLSLITNGNDVMTLFNSGNVAIGTTTDAGFKFDVNGSARVSSNSVLVGTFSGTNTTTRLAINNTTGTPNVGFSLLANNVIRWSLASYGATSDFTFFNDALGLDALFIKGNTNNVLIGTTTDNGFRLDVNGTARVFDLLDVAGTNGRLIFRSPEPGTRLNGVHWTNPTNTGSYGYIALSGGTGEMRMFASGTYFPTFYSNGSERMRIPTTGNVLINTTTDAGFRLDVNGTARIQGNTTITGTLLYLSHTSIGLSGNVGTGILELFNSSGSAGNTRISLGGVTYLNIYQPRNISSGIIAGAINTITTPIAYAWDSGSASPNLFQLNPSYNFTGTYSGIVRGFYYNPTLTSMTGVTHYAIHSTSGRVRLEGLPTSPTGLSAGDLYNDGGTIKIV